jgi:MerR family transcriptional regulator, light-induced transcriptional regulator
MINNVLNTFSIYDLEVLSGIKAHTIRIWEKRYALLNPTRLNRNIRVYGLLDLQKILNVSFLQKHKFKISELSKMADGELEDRAKHISTSNLPSNYHLNSLLVSMFSLNQSLFEETYQEQIKTQRFTDIFSTTYLPLLYHIGILWQTKGIKPIHGHFISNLIYQKIALNTASLSPINAGASRVNILFLPTGEIHEIGLLFYDYHLKSTGERTIYLGRDIPFNNLTDINNQFQEIRWICDFVIARTDAEKNDFISQMNGLLHNTKNTCAIVGQTWSSFDPSIPHKNMSFYDGFDELMKD